MNTLDGLCKLAQQGFVCRMLVIEAFLKLDNLKVDGIDAYINCSWPKTTIEMDVQFKKVRSQTRGEVTQIGAFRPVARTWGRSPYLGKIDDIHIRLASHDVTLV